MRFDNLPDIDSEEESYLFSTTPKHADAFASASTSADAPAPGTSHAPGASSERDMSALGSNSQLASGPRHAARHAASSPELYDYESWRPAPDVSRPRRSKGYTKYVIAAVCALALVGVGVAVAATLGQRSAEVPVVEPEPAKTTVEATVKADGVFILGEVAARGDVLENVAPATDLGASRADAYYRATYNGAVVYVEKSAVRTSDEEVPETWVGYAAEGAIIYANPDFTGEDILTLQLNEEVTVLDSFGDLLFVRNADGYEGYVPADMIMRERYEEPEVVEVPDYSGSYYSYGSGSSGGSGSSSGGGSNSGGGSSFGGGSPSGGSGSGATSEPSGSSGPSSVPSTSGDGDEMAMPVGFAPVPDPFLWGVGVAYADEPSSSKNSQSAQAEGDKVSATVLMDGVQLYVAILDRGDEVTVKIDDFFDFSDEADEASGAEGAISSASDSSSASAEPVPHGSGEEASLLAADDENLCTVIVNEQEVTMPEKLLRLEDEPAYEAWMGYALEGAVLYSDYELTSAAEELEVNEELNVVDFVGSVLVVETDSGVFYLDGALVSTEPVEVPEDEPSEEPSDEPASIDSGYVAPSYSGGGSAGGSGSGHSSGGSGASTPTDVGSSGGGSDSGSSGGEQSGSEGSGGSAGSEGSESEWTAPKL